MGRLVAGEELSGMYWCPGASGAMQEPAGAESILTGVGLSSSTPHSRDHGEIQCLGLGSPPDKTWANWCELIKGSKADGPGSARGSDGSRGAGSRQKPN